jgi:hypothetical protein
MRLLAAALVLLAFVAPPAAAAEPVATWSAPIATQEQGTAVLVTGADRVTIEPRGSVAAEAWSVVVDGRLAGDPGPLVTTDDAGNGVSRTSTGTFGWQPDESDEGAQATTVKVPDGPARMVVTRDAQALRVYLGTTEVLTVDPIADAAEASAFIRVVVAPAAIERLRLFRGALSPDEVRALSASEAEGTDPGSPTGGTGTATPAPAPAPAPVVTTPPVTPGPAPVVPRPVVPTPPARPTATAARLATAVRRALDAAGARGLARSGAALRLRAERAGTATVSLRAGDVLVARGRQAFSRAGTATVRLTTTSAGRRLLARRRSLAVTVTARFAPQEGPAAVQRAKLTLRR